jgi:hypothetical protein
MRIRRALWTGFGLALLATALIATLAVVAWLHGLDGDFSLTIDDETVRVHSLHGGSALALAIAGVVCFAICLLVLPLGLLLVLAVPLIVLAAVAFGVLLPVALVLAVVATPLVLVALFVRWLWRRSAGTTTIRA